MSTIPATEYSARMFGFIFISILIYLFTFILIMDTGTKTFDEDFRINFKCSYRYQTSIAMVDPELGLTRTFKKETKWNKIFYPLELLFLR